jgi:hypothetical protein
MRRYKALAGLTAGLMLLGSAAFGDVLDNDGDLDAVGTQALDFGDVCPGSVNEAPAEHWVRKASNATVNQNNFQGGATVEFSVVSAPTATLAAKMGNPSSVVLDNNWRTASNGTESAKVASTVSLTAPEAEGLFGGTVDYQATAPFTVGSGGTTTRSGALVVRANVLAADHESCVDAQTVYTLDGFYAPVKFLDAVSIKGGSTLPLKFNLFDADGIKIEDEAAKIDVIFSNCTVAESSASGETVATVTAAGDREVRWDAEAGQYIYNYKSAKGEGCKTVEIAHDDADVVEQDLLTITLRK